VPGTGIEPVRQFDPPTDFKSVVSTYFTTRAIAIALITNGFDHKPNIILLDANAQCRSAKHLRGVNAQAAHHTGKSIARHLLRMGKCRGNLR
jgi:hypothetical protein